MVFVRPSIRTLGYPAIRYTCSSVRGLASMALGNRSEGSIGDAFASLSTNNFELPPRFGSLKQQLVGQNGEAILDSWLRLLKHLDEETIPSVNELSHSIIPEVDFSSIVQNGGQLPEKPKALLKDCGTIVIRGLVSERQALGWKQSVREYVKKNPSTKGFPANDRQVYEIYWSKAQLEARAHQNMLLAQTALNLVWDKQEHDKVVLSEAVAYCDRLRMRMPGDKSFNLGPHLDGGSLERWEDREYRKCYTEILEGHWEDHNAFNVSPRLNATVDMYNGPGGCSAFRSYQGWLSLSNCAPTNGSLRVFPDLKASTAYTLLRPFVTETGDRWSLDSKSPIFHGAAMGAGQELLPSLHSHISPRGFVTIPTVRPGDAVFWHCDTAHMVEAEHQGTEDASVFYIPSFPLCDINAMYLKRQRENFLNLCPPPDFPGGIGESEHIDAGSVADLSPGGKRAMGCGPFDPNLASTPGEKSAYEFANKTLEFN
ncbi:unnamed protein product [Clonostachys rhizophaga]|uniref:DUF1479-domain-containing protein n=1 Tax=Clonostachys rhizophaga TaxID=160324 RepID=A0A9N9VVR6_9HYPO|nr:unnamed protein product [Clonostachys rhizophaga]